MIIVSIYFVLLLNIISDCKQQRHYRHYLCERELQTSDGEHYFSQSDDKVLGDQPQHVDTVRISYSEKLVLLK